MSKTRIMVAHTCSTSGARTRRYRCQADQAGPGSKFEREHVDVGNRISLSVAERQTRLMTSAERLNALLGGEPVPLERIVFDHGNDRVEPPLQCR
jgi:hypothetical protein